DGFKGHLAIEPDTGIITDCALTKATGADNHEAAVGLELLDGEDSPVTVLADSAYGSGEFRAELAERGHTDRVKPAPVPRIIAGGFTVDDFTVDHAAGTATCPNGLARRSAAADGPLSARPALAARCGPAAPAAAPAKPFGSALTTRGHARPGGPLVPRIGWPNAVSIGLWSNGPSPG